MFALNIHYVSTYTVKFLAIFGHFKLKKRENVNKCLATAESLR